MLNVRQRRRGLRDPQPIAGLLELSAGFHGQASRTLRSTIGIFDPAQQQEALPAA
jgi:hypothetical protein